MDDVAAMIRGFTCNYLRAGEGLGIRYARAREHVLDRDGIIV
jgi:hypothetical protein